MAKQSALVVIVVSSCLMILSVTLRFLEMRISAFNKPIRSLHTMKYVEDHSESLPVRGSIWYNYTAVGEQQFFVYSVIASKSKRDQGWEHIVVNGWEIPAAINKTYKCCFFYDNGTETYSMSTEKRQFWVHSQKLEARQVVCGYPEDKIPERFGLALSKERCPTAESRHKITYPKAENNGLFAVCGKIVYGTKHPLHLIEWIEYQRHFGADKIVFYPYQDLDLVAMDVLQYYAINDVIEVVPMPFVPQLKKWSRHFSIHPNGEMYNDEQVAMFDAVERLQGYTYLGVYDTDEFLAPNKDIANSYVSLMKNLTNKYPKAANFVMLTQVHSLTYNKTAPESDLMIGQFGNRSESIMDCPKLLHITERVQPGTIWIHNGVPKDGYSTVQLKDSEAVIKHFRFCRNEWLEPSPKFKPNKCFSGFKIQHDDYMKSIVEAIGPNVRRTRQILGL